MTAGGDDLPLAVYRRRERGAIRTVELTTGDSQTGRAPLQVRFRTPDGVTLAVAESAAATAMLTLTKSPDLAARYGLEHKILSDTEVFALSKVITAVETAIALWTDWNFAWEPAAAAEGEEKPAPVKAPLTPENISRLLLEDPDIRAAWSVQLDAASPLEQAEGNAFGASPNGNSEEAPNTAATASATDTPAPAADDAPTAPSAPG